MGKLSKILACAAVFALFAAPAHAVEFKLKGGWMMGFQYGQNGNFTNKGHQGYDYLEDDFEARTRVDLQLDAIASDDLSGQVYFEIGKSIWGKAKGSQAGAALGADANDVIKLKRAFIDWQVPDTSLRVRMGIQGFRNPYYALDGPIILTADGSGIMASYTVNSNVSITGFWMRPFNDNYVAAAGRDDSNFMDNMDIGGLMIPLRFDGFAATPWGMYAAIGPNTFRNDSGQFENRMRPPDGNYVFSGMFPLMGNDPKINPRSTHAYGNAWWAGFTGEFTLWEPYRVAWEFTYGSVSWADDWPMDRKGWMGALLFEYKTDWGVPGLYGWYASGDDDNLSNGSERLPSFANDFGESGFSDTFACSSATGMERERVIGNTPIGTWGVGARIKNLSFFPNLKHTIHFSFRGGTNSSGILEKIHARTGKWMSVNNIYPASPGAVDQLVGRDNTYLTEKDHAIEFGILNQYKIYDNLTLNLEFGYVHLMIDRSDKVWGLAQTGGGGKGLRDAWNISALFKYTF